MKSIVALTLLLTGCTCGSPPPAAPPAAPPPAVEAAPVAPVDHGRLTYEWHAQLPTGAFTGLRAWSDGAVEIGGSSPQGLAWTLLRMLTARELSEFEALKAGPDVAGLPPLIPDTSAPASQRVTWTILTAEGTRSVKVEGAFRTRVPALEALDRALIGEGTRPPRRSFVSATLPQGERHVSLACDALSQPVFREVAHVVTGVATPDSRLTRSPTLLRVENVSLLHGTSVEVHEDGALVRQDEDGVPHVGMLDATAMTSVRSTLDHIPWDEVARICEK